MLIDFSQLNPVKRKKVLDGLTNYVRIYSKVNKDNPDLIRQIAEKVVEVDTWWD
jgi:hypothetical protein